MTQSKAEVVDPQLSRALSPFDHYFSVLIAGKSPIELRHIHGDIQTFLALMTKTSVSDQGKTQQSFQLPQNTSINTHETIQTLTTMLYNAIGPTDRATPVNTTLLKAVYEHLQTRSETIKTPTETPQNRGISPVSRAIGNPSEPPRPPEAPLPHVSFLALPASAHPPSKGALQDTSRTETPNPAAQNKLQVLGRWVAKKLHLKYSPDATFTLTELLTAYAYHQKLSSWRTHRALVENVLNNMPRMELQALDTSREAACLVQLTTHLDEYTRRTGKSIEPEGTLALIIDYTKAKHCVQKPVAATPVATISHSAALAIQTRLETTLKKLKLPPDYLHTQRSISAQAKALLDAYAHPPLFFSNRHYKIIVAGLLTIHPHASADEYCNEVYAIFSGNLDANPQGTLAMVLRTLEDLATLERGGHQDITTYLTEQLSAQPPRTGSAPKR